jgi:hypothetical protein
MTTQSIEKAKPTGVAVRRKARRGLDVYKSVLDPVMPALILGKRLFGQGEFGLSIWHDSKLVPKAREARARWLAELAPAWAAHSLLREACYRSPTREESSVLVAIMLGAFAVKPDEGVLNGMLDVLESDEVATVTGLEPLHVSLVGLVMACRKLIRMSKFTPKPAELAEACLETERELWRARVGTERLEQYLQKRDAILLEFDHDEWERPYQTPQYRPILRRMLELHDTYGDGSEKWDEQEWDDDGNPLYPFARLVKAEQHKLPPEEPEE